MNTFEDYKKTTDNLTDTILNSNDNLESLMEHLKSEQLDMELKDFFNMMLPKKGMTLAQVVQKSGLQSAYTYQIFSGEKKHPSRNKLLALAFAMNMTLEEIQQLLKVAHVQMLYPRNRQDLIVIYALREHCTLIEVNELLEDLQEELLM